AERPRLVARGEDHAPTGVLGGRGSDDHGPPLEVRPVAELVRHVVRVEVDVEDPRRGRRRRGPGPRKGVRGGSPRRRSSFHTTWTPRERRVVPRTTGSVAPEVDGLRVYRETGGPDRVRLDFAGVGGPPHLEDAQ